MTIKEVEQVLDIPRATVRFYEKEELINPKRSGNSYREYSEDDIATLKKIIILRKIGMSVADIKSLFNNEISMQDMLQKNIDNLQLQMKELQGAINVCKEMQDKHVENEEFDTEYYWKEIQAEEKAGNKFLEIINDVIQYERKVFLGEFGLLSSKGELRYGKIKSFFTMLGYCLMMGVLWYFIHGQKKEDFIEGFFWPFMCITIHSILGLPVHFIRKKNPKLAGIITNIGFLLALGIIILAILAAIIL